MVIQFVEVFSSDALCMELSVELFSDCLIFKRQTCDWGFTIYSLASNYRCNNEKCFPEPYFCHIYGQYSVVNCRVVTVYLEYFIEKFERRSCFAQDYFCFSLPFILLVTFFYKNCQSPLNESPFLPNLYHGERHWSATFNKEAAITCITDVCPQWDIFLPEELTKRNLITTSKKEGLETKSTKNILT